MLEREPVLYTLLIVAVLGASISLLYGPILGQVTHSVFTSGERLFSLLLMTFLSIIFLVENASSTRVLLHDGMPSRVGIYALGLSLALGFIAPGIGLTYTFDILSLFGFVAAFLVFCFDLFLLWVLIPIFVSLPLGLVSGPGLGNGELSALSYLGLALLLGSVLYRSSLFRGLMERRPREPCPRCNDAQTDYCVYCGKIRLLRPRVSQVNRISRSSIFLLIAMVSFLLHLLDAGMPWIGLGGAWMFYSRLFTDSLRTNWETVVALVGGLSILGVAYAVRMVDEGFDDLADSLESKPELLRTYESFRRARGTLERTITGDEAFQTLKRSWSEATETQFAADVSQLQTLGALQMAYLFRNGSLCRAWKLRGP